MARASETSSVLKSHVGIVQAMTTIGCFTKKQPSRCAKFRLLTTMKQPIYNNRNATNDEKIQENLVTKTNTLTVRSIEQNLETVRSVTKTNMADYLVEPKQSRSAGVLRRRPGAGLTNGKLYKDQAN